MEKAVVVWPPRLFALCVHWQAEIKMENIEQAFKSAP